MDEIQFNSFEDIYDQVFRVGNTKILWAIDKKDNTIKPFIQTQQFTDIKNLCDNVPKL
jgi:hypothetical protein